jgi:hypothetical protein
MQALMTKLKQVETAIIWQEPRSIIRSTALCLPLISTLVPLNDHPEHST